jgi:hypothetical protein
MQYLYGGTHHFEDKPQCLLLAECLLQFISRIRIEHMAFNAYDKKSGVPPNIS